MDPLGNKYSYWARIVHRFKARRDIPFRKKFFVGYDLHGNTYWEFSLHGNQQTLRRIVEPYKKLLFKSDYYNSIPPQWVQWLRRTRPNAPSLEELINDEVRQQNIKLLAQQADHKWQMEKERMELEHQVKLQKELDAVKAPKQEAESEEVDPWKTADSNVNDQPEAAKITPRR